MLRQTFTSPRAEGTRHPGLWPACLRKSNKSSSSETRDRMVISPPLQAPLRLLWGAASGFVRRQPLYEFQEQRKWAWLPGLAGEILQGLIPLEGMSTLTSRGRKTLRKIWQGWMSPSLANGKRWSPLHPGQSNISQDRMGKASGLASVC